MTTATVSMNLDADTVAVFEAASAEDKTKLCTLWELLVREYKESPEPLRRLMDTIGGRARERGLTERELESILNAE